MNDTTQTYDAPEQTYDAPQAGTRSSRILFNAGFRALADIGSKIATAALYIFVARKLGASEFGIFVFALAFVGVVTAIGGFGQDIVLVREVARDHRAPGGVLLQRHGLPSHVQHPAAARGVGSGRARRDERPHAAGGPAARD